MFQRRRGAQCDTRANFTFLRLFFSKTKGRFSQLNADIYRPPEPLDFFGRDALCAVAESVKVIATGTVEHSPGFSVLPTKMRVSSQVARPNEYVAPLATQPVRDNHLATHLTLLSARLPQNPLVLYRFDRWADVANLVALSLRPRRPRQQKLSRVSPTCNIAIH